MELTDLAVKIESNVPLPEVVEVKRRGRPKGSTNKAKNIEVLQRSLPKLTPNKPPKWAQKEPKAPKEPREPKGFTIIGALNRTVAAIEFEDVSLTKEQKEHLKEQLAEVAEWRKLCTCTHSKTSHKTDGTGKCMITDCKCEEYE